MEQKLELIAQSESNSRLIIENDYINLPTTQDKIKHLEKVNKQIFNWKIKDLLKTSNELLSFFIKEKVEYGAGYGMITAGVFDVLKYDQSPSERFPEERYLLKDYTDKIDKLVQSVVRATYNHVELKEYFSSFENYQKWISLNFKRIKDTINLNIYLFLKELFTLTKVEVKGSNIVIPDTDKNLTTIYFDNSPLFAELSEFKKKFYEKIKIVKVKDKELKSLIKEIKNTYQIMVAEPTDQYHLDSEIKGYPITISPENLCIILSNEDKIEWETTNLTTFYNPNYFDLPDIKKFYLNIPKGSAIILDKRALQISPFFEGTFTSFYPNTLDTDIFSHFQYRLGIFKLYPAVLITNLVQ